MKRDLVYIPCTGYGDLFSNNGMVHYFCDIYDYIQYVIETNPDIISLAESMHHDMVMKNKIRFCIPSEVKIDKNMTDVVNTSVCGDRNDMFRDQILSNRYFDNFNHFPNQKIEDDKIYNNTIQFYKYIGLPISLRLTRFHYVRRHNIEKTTMIKYLKQFNINKDESYIIRADYSPHEFKEKLIPSDKKQININYLHKDPLHLLLLIECAKEIHVLENSIGLMIYFTQYADILKRIPVFYHVYARNRGIHCINMMRNPELENWTFYE